MQVWSLGWEDPLEEDMATHSSILAWRAPWTEEPDGVQFISHNELAMTEWLSMHTRRGDMFQSLDIYQKGFQNF